MIIDDNIKDEKLQYNIDREASKLSALSSGTIDKYEYMTSEDILPSDQSQIIEPSNFTYSPLGKAFRKQKKNQKTIENKKQVEFLKVLKSTEQKLTIKDANAEDQLNEETKYEIGKV